MNSWYCCKISLKLEDWTKEGVTELGVEVRRKEKHYICGDSMEFQNEKLDQFGSLVVTRFFILLIALLFTKCTLPSPFPLTG